MLFLLLLIGCCTVLPHDTKNIFVHSHKVFGILRSVDVLSLISSETFLSARSKRLEGCTHTREMIMVAAVSFVFARTRLRVGLASTPKRSPVELFCSRALWARAQ